MEPAQDGGGNGDIGKNFIPLGKGLVGGEDSGCLLVPSGITGLPGESVGADGAHERILQRAQIVYAKSRMI